MRKKLLCINNGYPTKQNPQFTTYIKSIAKCLEKSGFSVDLFVIKYNSNITILNKLIKYIQYWIKAVFIDLNNYDIIYINHLPFVWTILFNPSLKNKKVYVHWHGNELVSNTYFIRFTLNLIKKRGTGFLHIAPSLYFKNKLVEIMEYNVNDILISPSGGVDTNHFKPNYRNRDQIIIGYAAGLQKNKGADILLSLIHKHSEIEKIVNRKVLFKVINYGKEAGYYLEQFKNFTSLVEIAEKVPKHNMPLFYQSIDLLIMPSEGESLGLVALEAMSCNIPVVAYKLCAFPEFIIPGVSGELIEYDENNNICVNRYLNKIGCIINNYEEYSPMNIVYDKYSEESVIEFYKLFLNV